WSLIILGEGSFRSELECLSQSLDIVNSVHFLGRVKNPYEYLQQADIFVMSSRFEGFPNALCEAMACGLPVISTDCPSGPPEIIRDGIDGILVKNEDIEALAKAMTTLISDEEKRQKLGNAAKEITQRFDLDKIMGMWGSELNNVTRFTFIDQ
ncbi:MAG: glycosyltransferase, partial [Crocosphaera sp.]|uniref:glycosyltransferase n=1 Tax=Crocosphaera sp. TaxID=2729996 RepID=UPI0025835618